MKDFKGLLSYKKISRSGGIQLGFSRFFKESNKIWWYLIKIFHNLKIIFGIKKCIDFNGYTKTWDFLRFFLLQIYVTIDILFHSFLFFSGHSSFIVFFLSSLCHVFLIFFFQIFVVHSGFISWRSSCRHWTHYFIFLTQDHVTTCLFFLFLCSYMFILSVSVFFF